MTRFRELPPRILLPFVAWTMVGLFFATRLFFGYQLSDNPIGWNVALSWSLLDWYLWAGLSPLIFRAARTFGLGRSMTIRHVFLHLLFSVAFATFHTAVYGTVLWFLRPIPEDNVTLVSVIQGLYLGKFHIGIMTYWVLVLLRLTLDFYRRYREEELRVSRVETQLAQAQLRALKMQLHPHFLFNTLNAVSALMHRDVDAAERMIARLSDLLRLTLESGGVHEVPLRQELDVLRRYLEIEQVRFADRLQVAMDIDPEALDARVPNLILQPLVENAIRHGIAPSSSAGRIEIAARRENGTLHLQVSDDGPGLPWGRTHPAREGVGISNTKARLSQLYGSAHRFDLSNGDRGGLQVSLSFPYHLGEEELAAEHEGDVP